jgi:hypothetical protein
VQPHPSPCLLDAGATIDAGHHACYAERASNCVSVFFHWRYDW